MIILIICIRKNKKAAAAKSRAQLEESKKETALPNDLDQAERENLLAYKVPGGGEHDTVNITQKQTNAKNKIYTQIYQKLFTFLFKRFFALSFFL